VDIVMALGGDGAMYGAYVSKRATLDGKEKVTRTDSL
jgi:hypothetical protein